MLKQRVLLWVIMSYEYDFVLIFVSGCPDFLLKVVDVLYGVHWLRLRSCLISLAPFCFPSSRHLYFRMAYARRSNLVSPGHSPCESESVHGQCYEDGTERWTSEYSCYFSPCLAHFRMSCGHALVVDWTPRCCYVLEVKCFLELMDVWLLFWGGGCAAVSLKPWHMDWVRDFDFMLNLFSLPSPWNYYLFLRWIP